MVVQRVAGVLVGLTLVSTALLVPGSSHAEDASSARAAAVEGDPTVPEVRIASGTLSVDSSWSGGCTDGNGWCTDDYGSTNLSFTSTSDARLHVTEPGPWVQSATHAEGRDWLTAPMIFDSWDYDDRVTWRYQDPECGSSTDTWATVGGVEFASAPWETGLVVSPGADLSLDAEPGWWYWGDDPLSSEWTEGWWWGEAGAWDTDFSNGYPRVLRRYTSGASNGCWEGSEWQDYYPLEHLATGYHASYPPNQARLGSSSTTATKLEGCTLEACSWRVDAVRTVEHRAQLANDGGYEGTGSTTTTWSYVVEGRNLVEADPCDRPDAERHYTNVKSTAILDLALSPDADVTRLDLGFHWCETSEGSLISTEPGPSALWTLTDNWILLGALEAFAGISVVQPEVSEVEVSRASVTTRTTVAAKVDALAAVTSVIPVGKLLKPVRALFERLDDKIDSVTSRWRTSRDNLSSAKRTVAGLQDEVSSCIQALKRTDRLLADAQQDLQHASTPAARARIKARIAELKSARAELRELHGDLILKLDRAMTRLESARDAWSDAKRRLGLLLDEIRRGILAVSELPSQVDAALQKAVDSVPTDWLREIAQVVKDRLMESLRPLLDAYKAAVDTFLRGIDAGELTASGLAETVLGGLQQRLEHWLGKASSIDMPIWDGLITVAVTPDGEVEVFDQNSESRFVFTIHVDHEVSTTD